MTVNSGLMRVKDNISVSITLIVAFLPSIPGILCIFYGVSWFIEAESLVLLIKGVIAIAGGIFLAILAFFTLGVWIGEYISRRLM